MIIKKKIVIDRHNFFLVIYMIIKKKIVIDRHNFFLVI